VRRHGTAVATALATAVLASGCGVPGGAGSSGVPSAPLSCSAPPSTMALPPEFPKQVPVPAGAAITGVEHRSDGRLIVSALAPADFNATLTFMQQAFPAAGLTLRGGEVDEGDAESDFTGTGLTGRWTLRERPGCGDTEVTVLVAKA